VLEAKMLCMAVTLFTADGSLDEESFRLHLRRLVDAGVGVFVASPGSGEGYALSPAETRRLCEIAVEECKGEVPVYANLREGRTAEETIALAREAIAAEVDLIQIYNVDRSHSFVPTEREQEAYFRECLDALDYPISLAPGSPAIATGSPSVELLARLCQDYPQIESFHLGTDTMAYLIRARDVLPESVEVWVGMASGLQGLALGGSAIMAMEPNVIPHTCRMLVRAFAAGNVELASDAAKRIRRFTTVLDKWSPHRPRALKMALNVLGLPGGDSSLRKPYLMPGSEALDEMRTAFEALGVADYEAHAVSQEAV